MKKFFLSLLLSGVLSIPFTNVYAQKKTYPAKPVKTGAITRKKNVWYGTASFYAKKFNGRKTANGDRYNSTKFTAACNVLPLNTWIKVTNLRNKRWVIVIINDRMHAKNKRLVDLSRDAARKLGYTKKGLTRVKVQVIANYKP